MLYNKSILYLLLLMLVAWPACILNNDSSSSWNIPEDDIVRGGPAKDGVPTLFNPAMLPASQAGFVRDPNLVVGIVVNGQPRAYPHAILDWHEVINERFSADTLLTISYCPLTGSAIVFDGNHGDLQLTFGVSGLLYNNNLIMFDRQTDSNWPQMRLQSDEGSLRNRKQKIFPSIETSWETWKKLFPNTLVLSPATGFNKSYSTPGSAYPGYSDLHSPPLFRRVTSFLDERLPPKQRVHGIIIGDGVDNFVTRAYTIERSKELRITNDVIDGEPVLVINDGKNNFAVSYLRQVNGIDLRFVRIDLSEDFPVTLKDLETGSTWNILGVATDGPLVGTKLARTLSYNAYWFAWAAFYRGVEISR